MGYLGATLTQVFTHVRGQSEHVTLRCDQMGNGATECRWRHVPEARGGFRGFWKSQLVELSPVVRRRKVTFACSPRPWASVAREVEGRWKSQNRKNVYLSPYVEEPLDSKVIKSFVPELRSRKCFSCFGIPMLYIYIYIWTVYVRFTHSHIWLWYSIISNLKKNSFIQCLFSVFETFIVCLF